MLVFIVIYNYFFFMNVFRKVGLEVIEGVIMIIFFLDIFYFEIIIKYFLFWWVVWF